MATAQLVTITATSGRTFRGVVDPRTDADRLWVRGRYGQAVVLRPISWDRIDSIGIAGRDYAVDDFRELAEQLKLATPRQPWSELTSTTANLHRVPVCFPLVQSLYAEVSLSGWNADAAADGYILRIVPRDERGHFLPVEGIVEATLHGYRNRSGMPLEFWSELARWSQPITLACYGPDGGSLRLPFAAVAADLAVTGSPRRVLRVRLQAPGHGTFESEVPFQAVRAIPPE